MSEPLLATSFLFRFAAPCLQSETLWTPQGITLDESFSLPAFGKLDDLPTPAEIRAAWNEAGLSFTVRVEGKRQQPWCRENRIEDSDGLHLFIDTRDTHNIHRASRFCHHFVFLPSGGGHRLDEPVAEQLLINRARENAKPVRPGLLKVRGEKRIHGYLLECHIPAAALTGFDPDEHRNLGFTYAVADRELGEQTFICGGEFPYREDPSLWGTLELVG